MQLASKFFRRVDSPSQMGQNLCQRVEAITIRGGMQTMMEGKAARGIRTLTRASRFRLEVDQGANLKVPTLPHPLLRSRMVGCSTVRELGYFGRCLSSSLLKM